MQYVLTYKSTEGVDALMILLRNNGFALLHGLNNVHSLKEKIIGICIDFDDKKVFQLNVTCMASWCC